MKTKIRNICYRGHLIMLKILGMGEQDLFLRHLLHKKRLFRKPLVLKIGPTLEKSGAYGRGGGYSKGIPFQEQPAH